eukprot:280480-Alexandrium_andersonii.AAC.1
MRTCFVVRPLARPSAGWRQKQRCPRQSARQQPRLCLSWQSMKVLGFGRQLRRPSAGWRQK